MSRRHQHPSNIIAPRGANFAPDVPFDAKDNAPYSYGVCTRAVHPFVACLSVWLADDLPPYIADMEEHGALFVTRPIGRRVAVCELLHYIGNAPEEKAPTLRKMAGMLEVYVFRDKPPYTRHIPER